MVEYTVAVQAPQVDDVCSDLLAEVEALGSALQRLRRRAHHTLRADRVAAVDRRILETRRSIDDLRDVVHDEWVWAVEEQERIFERRIKES